MDDFDMSSGFHKIAYKYREIKVDNILRLLIRAQIYFAARKDLIKILAQIDKREEVLDGIRNVVLSIKDDQEMDRRKREIQGLSNSLQKVTKEVSEKIEGFLASYKQFGKSFVYDNMVSSRLTV